MRSEGRLRDKCSILVFKAGPIGILPEAGGVPLAGSSPDRAAAPAHSRVTDAGLLPSIRMPTEGKSI
jgi:hypothetical protein